MGCCNSKPPDINAICLDGKVAELESALSRYPDLLRVRVESGLTPLHVCVYNGHDDCVRILLAKGAEVNAVDKVGDTALSYCFLDSPLRFRGKDGKKDILDTLIKYKADVTMKDGLTGETFLHKAVGGGHVHSAHLLLATKQMEINAVNNVGDTALHMACADGHYSILQELLMLNAKLHIKNRQGHTPLHKACALGHIGNVVMLIEADHDNSDVNGKDVKGQTPLHVSCAHNHSELAIMLIEEYGALKHTTDNNGREPAQLFVAQPGDDNALIRKSSILEAISVHKQEVMAAEGRTNSPRGSHSGMSSPFAGSSGQPSPNASPNASPTGSPKSRRGSAAATNASKNMTPVDIGAATPPSSGGREKKSFFKSLFSSSEKKKKK